MGVYVYEINAAMPRIVPATALPETGLWQTRTQGRGAEQVIAVPGNAYMRHAGPANEDPVTARPVARPRATVADDWGTSFPTCLAGHLVCNMTWAEWSKTVFVYGRRVPQALGAGDVIIVPTGGRMGEYRLGTRRAVDAYPTFTVVVRLGARGDEYDEAMERAEQIYNLLTASWTGVIPGKVDGHGDIVEGVDWNSMDWSPVDWA